MKQFAIIHVAVTIGVITLLSGCGKQGDCSGIMPTEFGLRELQISRSVLPSQFLLGGLPVNNMRGMKLFLELEEHWVRDRSFNGFGNAYVCDDKGKSIKIVCNPPNPGQSSEVAGLIGDVSTKANIVVVLSNKGGGYFVTYVPFSELYDARSMLSKKRAKRVQWPSGWYAFVYGSPSNDVKIAYVSEAVLRKVGIAVGYKDIIKSMNSH